MKKIFSFLLIFIVSTISVAQKVETLNDYLLNNQNLSEEMIVEGIRKLLAAGADISLQDLRGNTPLMTAITLGKENVAKFLTDRIPLPPEGRLNLKIKNSDGETALSLAKKQNMQAVVDMIEARLAVFPHRSKIVPEDILTLPGLEA